MTLRWHFHIFGYLFAHWLCTALVPGRSSSLPAGGPLPLPYVLTGHIGPRRKSLVLYGPSLTGKTTWARSLGNHIYSQRLLNVTEVAFKIGEARYHVLDDVDIRYFPAWKDWLGGMQWIPVRLMYRDVINMPWGRPCIWCNNKDPRDVMRRSMNARNGEGDGQFSQEDLDWLEANCTFINVEEPIAIFHANT